MLEYDLCVEKRSQIKMNQEMLQLNQAMSIKKTKKNKGQRSAQCPAMGSGLLQQLLNKTKIGQKYKINISSGWFIRHRICLAEAKRKTVQKSCHICMWNIGPVCQIVILNNTQLCETSKIWAESDTERHFIGSKRNRV